MRKLQHITKAFLFISVLVAASERGIAQPLKKDIPSQVFAPGVVSSPFIDAAVSFSPDGKTAYFCQGTKYLTICSSTMRNGKWCQPVVLPFSGKWKDWDPFLSPDGKRLLFVSNRPLTDTSTNSSSHLWYADRLAPNTWSDPSPINAPFNFDGIDNYAPTISSSGTLYFCSEGRNGQKGMTSYYSKWQGDRYGQPIQLTLNGNEDVMDPFVSPDESYIVFVSGSDIYVSVRKDTIWSAGQKLGHEINNGDANSNPYVSRDGKTLYYTSARVKGFYIRDKNARPFDYSHLLEEMKSIFNGRPNILMAPFQFNK